MILCHCCGADLTMPQFHNGKPYGWTCIHRVTPKQKRSKDVFHAVEFKHDPIAPTGRQVVAIEWNGQRKAVVFYCNEQGKHIADCTGSGFVYQNGVLYVSELKLKGSGFSAVEQIKPTQKKQDIGAMGSAVLASLGL